jgi:hypothetical protein
MNPISDIYEVQVQFVPVSPVKFTEMEQEFAALNPGWSMHYDPADMRLEIAPPAGMPPNLRDALRVKLTECDLSGMSMQELTALLADYKEY